MPSFGAAAQRSHSAAALGLFVGGRLAPAEFFRATLKLAALLVL